MRRAIMLLLLLFFSAVLIGSRYYPTVQRIEVMGGNHYSREEILALANLAPGTPFLWVTPWHLKNLMSDPWISHVRVIRHWPDTISLSVWERQPVLTDGERVYAIDGTVLPNATTQEGLTRLKGWGERRLDEVMHLLRLLAEFQPEMISYSPGGFEVRLANTRLYAPSVDALREHWAGFLSSMSQAGSVIAVYPWGVSVQP